MRTFILNILFLIFIAFISYGQKYFTLQAGAWNNVTNVWSLNGTTPCGCFPGNSLTNDTVIVNHPIDLTANLDANSLSQISVKNSGSLSNSAVDITITNSIVLADGSVNINKFIVGDGGFFQLKNSNLIINSRMLISGTFSTEFSNITVINGNIEVYASGKVFLGDNTHLQFLSGNYKNSGFTSVCDNCCLHISLGNITNNASGIFDGAGSIILDMGNIRNYGVWNNSLMWCAAGTTVGVSSSENCIAANIECKLAPLPMKLIYFVAYPSMDENILKWQIASETNVDYYTVEKSIDGNSWHQFAQVDPLGAGNDLVDYQLRDPDPLVGIVYYKLSQKDPDGNTVFAKILSLTNVQNTDLSIFPNPSNEFITVQLHKNHAYKYIKLMDATGKLLNQITIGEELIITIVLPEEKGYYFIQAESEDNANTYKMIKI
jgi:hypothetical protein